MTVARARWFAGVAFAALLVSPTAAGAQAAPNAQPAQTPNDAPARPLAQTQPAPTAAAAAPAEARSDDVVVTGTRITRPDYQAPNPIVSFNAAAIQQSGNTNLTNFLQRVPALTDSVDSGQTAGYNAISRPGASQFGEAGLNLLNLRGLGANRTLVLVDGRRHVAGEVSTAAVDINAIPTDLVERVDVLTGGASAIYGADGVSGVVNFILKRNLEGVQARAQMGISENGDAGNHFVSVIAGHNFADGRANVTLSYEYNLDEPLRTDDRRFLQQDRRQYLITNPNAPVDATGAVRGTAAQPSNVLTGDLHYAGESTYGAIDIDGDGFPDFRGDGQPYNAGRLIGGYAIGGDSTPAANYVGDLAPRIERHAANLLAHFDASDAFKVSVEGKFVQSDATTFYQYPGDYPSTLSVDNPFMPASIRNAALAAGLTSVNQTRDDYDYNRRGEEDLRRTYRGVLDVSGRISDHARYDVYYEYGVTQEGITKLNDRYNDRYLAALDVVTDPRTGQPTCRSSLTPSSLAVTPYSFTPGPNSGCIPINTFGANTANPAAVAWFSVNDVSPARIGQQVVDGSISGDFGQFFKLPGGPVAFAFGGEWRRETSSFDPNTLLQNNQFYQYDEPGGVQPIRGSFDVYEAFGELNAPILQDKPFAQTLSVGAAGRYSHYSTVGDTGTWQFNGVYAPVRDVSFRGSYGYAVRAPNVGELFTPTAPSTAFINDPCDVGLRSNGTQYRAANCATLLRGLGVNPDTFAPVTSVGGTGGDGTSFGALTGNPDLKAERATTWTAGVVLRPRFIPGLTMSADWYDIKIEGAISTPDVQTEAELCVDQPTLNNPYCANIARAAGPGVNAGRIQTFVVQPENVSQFRTAGLDVNVNYVLRTATAGTFDVRFVGGYLNRLDIIQTPGAVVEDDVDQPLRPKFNFTLSPTWTLGKVTLAYNLRWTDGEYRNPKQTYIDDPYYDPTNLARYSDLWQQDIQAAVAVNNRFSLYGGINNFADQRPDPDSTTYPISSLGRFFYMGVRLGLAGAR